MEATPRVKVRRLTKSRRRECPPVCVVTEGGRCALLEQICYPLSPAVFLGRYWRTNAHVVHGPRRRIEMLAREMMHGLALPRLLQETPSDEIHVWFATPAGNESFKTSDAEVRHS